MHADLETESGIEEERRNGGGGEEIEDWANGSCEQYSYNF